MVMFTDQASNERAFMIAKKLIERGRPIDEIVEDTGLTIGEIQALQ